MAGRACAASSESTQDQKMSADSKPALVVTRPTPLAALPPEVAERVNRDFVVRLAETPESLTSDGLAELSDRASGLLVTPFRSSLRCRHR